MNNVKPNNLHRWGLVWIVIGFVCLVTEMFGLDNPLWTLASVLCVILVAPPTPPVTWRRRVIEFVVWGCVLVVVVFAVVWIALAAGLKAGLLFACGALLIGIVMQIWAELGSRTAENQGPLALLIEKIKRI
jgi:hypothetical protein